MSNITLKEHLLLCVQRLKTYTNEQMLELNDAVVATLEEIITVLEKKADESAMTTALSTKADATSTTQALKTKANVTDVQSALDFFKAAGLYVDSNGDIAQTD